ncbi:MAG: ABC-F family ATP-binding cassette domain-containing protein [Chloroflexia bacterium]|nr:ABC-F family ATP-binding cassette domain-containing protein [Chloroflexia bacterium]
MPPTTLLTVSGLTKTYITDQIFAEVGFQIAEREHVALVGVNGAGKSTILRIIAGLEHANAGGIVSAQGLRVTYLPQETRFTSANTLRAEARRAFAPVLEMAARMREIETAMADAGDALDDLLTEYDRLQTRFEAGGGYDVEHRTDEVLHGLGFTAAQFDEPVDQLSGGQKTRVALAKALLADPDLLLLDEPTNHLDLEMLEWLETFLRGWSGACLIVSHDRYFLDRVTTRTLDLSFGRLEDYSASYARYLDLRTERMTRWQKEYDAQQAHITHQEEFIRKYGAGQRYREARGRQKKLDRLERVERPVEHDRLNLRLGGASRSGRVVLSTNPLKIGYDGPGDPTQLIATPELEIERGDRIGLMGPNGSGKTTLLKTLTGQLPPLKGRYTYGTNVKPGYYAQSHEQLRDSGKETPLSLMVHSQAISAEGARTYLGRFLFSGDDVHKSISALSGGERSRLALAALLLEQANLLILDEPTNHLDIQARETLEEMLADFDGTILFVSHDRYFMDRIATTLWIVEEGGITVSLGNYTDYQRRLGRRGAVAEPDTQEDTETQPAAMSSVNGNGGPLIERTAKGKPRRRNDAEAQRAMAHTEREIGRLEGKLNELSDALAIAGIDQDVAAIARLGEEYDRTQAALDDAYAAWETVSRAAEELTVAGA